jgi:hypothetical protein
MQPILPGEFEYRVRSAAILPMGIFLSIAAIVFAAVAYSNGRGLVINRIIFLPPMAATVFYWVAAAGFGVAVAAMIYRVNHVQRLILTSRAIVVPKSGWSSKEVEIPYTIIAGIKEIQCSSPMLLVVYRGGLAKIYASRLSKPDYDAIRQTLQQQIAALHQDECG